MIMRSTKRVGVATTDLDCRRQLEEAEIRSLCLIGAKMRELLVSVEQGLPEKKGISITIACRKTNKNSK